MRYKAINPAQNYVRGKRRERTYTHADVERIRMLKHLNELGCAISLIASKTDAELEEMIRTCTPIPMDLTSSKMLPKIEILKDAVMKMLKTEDLFQIRDIGLKALLECEQ